MFPFLKKSTKIPIGNQLKTDMHSHLLPGIDDGAPDMETSLQLIKGLVGLGYQHLITTPHVMNDMYPNTPEVILSKLEELRSAVLDAGIEVQIDAAAEYYVDEFFEDYIKSESLLCFDNNKVLIEQSMAQEYPRFKEVVFDLRLKGYVPIIAHPERYVYYNNFRHEFQWFKDAGCLLQVNLLSLQGYYGKMERQLAEYLFKSDLIDFLGTDCHHERHLIRLTGFAKESQVNLAQTKWANASL